MDATEKAEKKKTKTVLDKIVYAIRNQPQQANGCSRAAIHKYLKSALEYDNTKAIKLAIKKAVEKGTLEQVGQSFRVKGDAVVKAAVDEDSKLQIEDVSKPKTKQKPGVTNDSISDRVSSNIAERTAQDGDSVTVKYVGKLDNGYKFDSASSFTFVLGAGEVIKGWDMGVKGMKVGGKRKLVVPSKLGYGKRGCSPDIPPSATLHFEITLKIISSDS